MANNNYVRSRAILNCCKGYIGEHRKAIILSVGILLLFIIVTISITLIIHIHWQVNIGEILSYSVVFGLIFTAIIIVICYGCAMLMCMCCGDIRERYRESVNDIKKDCADDRIEPVAY